jgi:hypothetical protein
VSKSGAKTKAQGIPFHKRRQDIDFEEETASEIEDAPVGEGDGEVGAEAEAKADAKAKAEAAAKDRKGKGPAKVGHYWLFSNFSLILTFRHQRKLYLLD